MKKIHESMKIETWRELAKKVQQLSFMQETGEEFQKNLEKLNMVLQTIGIEGNIGKRNPKTLEQMGTSSLLQSIQDIHVPNNYKRATFYEKIVRLSNIGIESMKFCPMGPYQRFTGAVKRNLKEDIILQKCYTDGTFQLDKLFEINACTYALYNLHNANYVLIITLNQSLIAEKHNFVRQEESQAMLTSFNGAYPSKEELIKFEFPELVVQKQSLKWGESPIVKEKFDTFYQEEGYQKKIKMDSNHEYYYE